jgi:ribosomal protein S16
MSLRIRLNRIGRKRIYAYRIIATNSKNSRNTNKIIQDLGFYQPGNKNLYMKFNLQKYNELLNDGAQPTHVIIRLHKIAALHNDNVVIVKD